MEGKNLAAILAALVQLVWKIWHLVGIYSITLQCYLDGKILNMIVTIFSCQHFIPLSTRMEFKYRNSFILPED